MLENLIEIFASRSYHLKLTCTKFDSAPPDFLAGFKEIILLKKEGEGRGTKWGRKREERRRVSSQLKFLATPLATDQSLSLSHAHPLTSLLHH